MNWNLNFISSILLVKPKCNRGHVLGLNWITTWMSNGLYIAWSSIFIKNFVQIGGRRLNNWFDFSIKFFNWMWCATSLASCSKNCWMKMFFSFLSKHIDNHPNDTKWRHQHFWVKLEDVASNPLGSSKGQFTQMEAE